MTCYRVKPCPPGTECVGFYCVGGIATGSSSGGSSGGGRTTSLTCTSTSQCPAGTSCIGGICKKNPSTSATECTDVATSDSNNTATNAGGVGGGDCSAPGCGGGVGGGGGGLPPSPPEDQPCNAACTSHSQNFGENAPGCPNFDVSCRDCVNGLFKNKPKSQAPCTCDQFQTTPGSPTQNQGKCDEEKCEKCNEESGICEESCDGCVEKCSIPVNCSCKGSVTFEYTHEKCSNGSLSKKSCQEAAAEALDKEKLCGCPCEEGITIFENIRAGFEPTECVGISYPDAPRELCVYCEQGASKEIPDPDYVPPVVPEGQEPPPAPKITVYEWKKTDATKIGDECCGECNCHSECQGRKIPNDPQGRSYNACNASLKCVFVEDEDVPDNCETKTYCDDNNGAAQCPAGSTQTGSSQINGQNCIYCKVCGAPKPDEPDPRPCDAPRTDRSGECLCPTVNGPNWPDDPLDRTVYAWNGTDCVPSCPTCSPIYPLP